MHRWYSRPNEKRKPALGRRRTLAAAKKNWMRSFARFCYDLLVSISAPKAEVILNPFGNFCIACTREQEEARLCTGTCVCARSSLKSVFLRGWKFNSNAKIDINTWKVNVNWIKHVTEKEEIRRKGVLYSWRAKRRSRLSRFRYY